jgi:hypothetical protein
LSYFNTDKITYHEYFQTYVSIAAQLGPKAKVLELGVENGESLRMWQSLFPLGDVTGVDINENARWPRGTRKVISPQDDPGLPGKLGGEFNLIVDDASHNGITTRKSFEVLWPMVAKQGFYVVEDWTVALRADPHWGGPWGDSMLRTAEGFLPMLDYRDAQCDFITYKYGMVIIHRSAND